MSINAISSISFATYTPTVVDFEHEEIKRQLAILGLEISGKKSIDKVTLQQAQLIKETEAKEEALATDQVSKNESDEYNDELAYIFNYLGITQSKNVENDYRDAVNIIREKLMNETDRAEITYLNELKLDLDRIMASLGYSTLSIATTEKTGATVLGENNRVSMVTAGGFASSGK